MDAVIIGEIATVAVGLLGGGATGVAKLTRIAVAAEQLAEKIDAVTKQVQKTAATVAEHEVRLGKGGL